MAASAGGYAAAQAVVTPVRTTPVASIARRKQAAASWAARATATTRRAWRRRRGHGAAITANSTGRQMATLRPAAAPDSTTHAWAFAPRDDAEHRVAIPMSQARGHGTSRSIAQWPASPTRVRFLTHPSVPRTILERDRPRGLRAAPAVKGCGGDPGGGGGEHGRRHGVGALRPDEQRGEERGRDDQPGLRGHPRRRPDGDGQRGRDAEPDDPERRERDPEEDRREDRAA